MNDEKMAAATTIQQMGFERCEFGPDGDECEKCRMPNLQLYFQSPADAGRYCCAACIMAEYRANQKDYERAMNTEPATAA